MWMVDRFDTGEGPEWNEQEIGYISDITAITPGKASLVRWPDAWCGLCPFCEERIYLTARPKPGQKYLRNNVYSIANNKMHRCSALMEARRNERELNSGARLFAKKDALNSRLPGSYSG